MKTIVNVGQFLQGITGYLRCRFKRFGLNHALRYEQLYEIIRDKKPINILEIGVFNAENAVRMLNINPDIEANYYGFDLFEDLSDLQFETEIAIKPLTLDEAKNKLEKRTRANISLYKANTLELKKDFFQNFPAMDLIFIDGGHSIETQRNDWLLVKDLMTPKTIVIIDDFWNIPNSGCSFLVDELDEGKYIAEILPTADFYIKDWGILKTQFLKITLR